MKKKRKYIKFLRNNSKKKVMLSPYYLRTISVSPPCHLRIYMFGLDTDLVRGWYGVDMNLLS